ncbi:MAG TPA: lanthionine synthetase LanC family protein, partial [Pyrinomonadaceae bacterium]|nr:lanthionine synthetase LanC family protein [Pyrinomonadaceae bacterium]
MSQSRATPRRPWRPLLEGALRERALATVDEIVAALPGPESALISDASLARGAAGLAVLSAYLARAGRDDGTNAILFLQHAAQRISDEPTDHTLYGGFTGVAWALAHLRAQLLDADEDAHEAVDAALLDLLSQTPWRHDFDLVNGLVGIGVYALEQLPRSTAAEILSRVVERLE